MRPTLRRMGCILAAFLWGAPAVFAEAKAEEFMIVFSGQARAALYPCQCPKDRSGGVARRAQIIADLKTRGTPLLIVEAGFSFASGPLDESAQNADLDARRTAIYLAALKKMGYDALLVSSQEFAFGLDFLKSHDDGLFVSTNTPQGAPTLLKDIGGLKVGLIGLTDRAAMERGASEWKAPVQVLASAVSDLKKRGARVIVVLSALSPSDDKVLLEATPGIDVVVNGSESYGSVAALKVGGAIWVPTWWQTRQLGLLTLKMDKKGVVLEHLESMALDKTVPDEPQAASLVPACFSDLDCETRPGLIGRCESQGREDARCAYVEPRPVPVTIVVPDACPSCNVEGVIEDLKAMFGVVNSSQIKESDPKAGELLKELDVKVLPVYVFNGDIEANEVFPSLSDLFEKRGTRYILKPRASGVAAFAGRPRIPGRLDVFFDLSYPSLSDLFRRLKEVAEHHPEAVIATHFLAVEDQGKFLSRNGGEEVEEFRRMASVEALSPSNAFDYVICRSQRSDPGWWERCASDQGIDPERLKERAGSAQGEEDLQKKIRLTRELEVAVGPTLLAQNKDVYGIAQVPSVEEIEKIMGLEKKKE